MYFEGDLLRRVAKVLLWVLAISYRPLDHLEQW